MKYKCYCCNEIATTKEHSPPKCFFPKQKDLHPGSPDYRKNLLTVPSCEKHNTERSHDDEYAALAIIMIAEKSNLAFSFFIYKWKRVLLRQNGALGKKIFTRATPVISSHLHENLLIPYETVAVAYEKKRVDNVIQSIARALYYYESSYQDQWLGNCIIKSQNFLIPNFSLNPEYHLLMQANQAFDTVEIEKKGLHPDIFYYQIHKYQDKDWVIKMVFYSSIIFFALP